MCQVLTHCGFSGVSPDGNCAYVHWGSFTSNSRSVRRAIWFTWFSEPHECIQHLAVPGGHPSNYEPGATLLNFSDRANHDERTPYSVYRYFSWWILLKKDLLIKTTFYVFYNNLIQSLFLLSWFNVSVISLGGLITICCHPDAQHGQRFGEWGCHAKAIIDQWR